MHYCSCTISCSKFSCTVPGEFCKHWCAWQSYPFALGETVVAMQIKIDKYAGDHVNNVFILKNYLS